MFICHVHELLKLTLEGTIKMTISFREKVTITGFSSKHLFGIVRHFRWNYDEKGGERFLLYYKRFIMDSVICP